MLPGLTSKSRCRQNSSVSSSNPELITASATSPELASESLDQEFAPTLVCDMDIMSDLDEVDEATVAADRNGDKGSAPDTRSESTSGCLPGADEAGGSCGTFNIKTPSGAHIKPKLTEGRRRCWDGRRDADPEFLACFGKAPSIGAVPAREHDGLRQVAKFVDSGAAESVADPGCFPGYQVTNHDVLVFYQSATGEPIQNVGQQNIALLTREGRLKGLRIQATASVKQPLASGKRILEEGNAGVFAPPEFGGSFILNLASLEETQLREDAGNCVLDAWVPPASAVANAVGFPRHQDGTTMARM